MATDTLAGLVDALRQYRLLEPAHLDALPALQARCADPRALAKELIQKGWLTPYQVNQLFRGKGHELVLGSYVLLELLGEGGMGQVFKARHQKLGRVVALKVIRKDRLASAEARKRFHREIQAVSQLSHPNVVMAFDADHSGETHFFAMEYVEGTDLARRVREKGPLAVRDACLYVREAALGLQHAFEKGLVHRDIKPSNLIATAAALKGGPGPRVKLMDMGLVAVRSDDDGASTLTQEGAVVGTPDYLAPEQARNARSVDIRADIYSLGCTFYYLLTGQAPFSGGTLTEKLLKHHWDTATPVEHLRPDVPPEVASVIRKLMAKKPEERYQSPAEVVAAIDAALDPSRAAAITAALPVAAAIPARAIPAAAQVHLATPVSEMTQPVGTVAFPARSSRGKRGWVLGGAGAVLLLGLGLLGVLLIRPGPSPVVETHADTEAAPRPSGELTAFDQLRRSDISPAELASAGGGDASQAPAELVAVLGDSRLKHWNLVGAVAYRPDGKAVASASADGSAKVWDARTGQVLRTFKGHAAPVVQVGFAGNGKVYTAGQDRTVRLWNLDNGRELQSFVVTEMNVPPVFFAEGTRCAAVSVPRSNLTIWDVESGREVRTLAQKHAVLSLACTPDGKSLAVYCGDGLVRLWDLTREDAGPETLSPQSMSISCLALSPDGKMLAAGSGRDNETKVWDLTTRKELVTVPAAGGAVYQVAFSPDGTLLATATAGPKVLVWQLPGGKAAAELTGHLAQISCVAFSPDGKTLISGSADWQVKLWDLEHRTELLPRAPVGGTGVAVSPDGKSVAWGGRDGVVRIWDVASHRNTQALPGVPEAVWALAFSPNSKALAGGVNSGAVQVWDPSSQRRPQVLSGHIGPVRSVEYSPDGKTLASGGNDQTVRLWDGVTGVVQAEPLTPRVFVYNLAFGPGGKTLAAGCGDGSVHTWEMPSRGEKTIRAPQRDVFGVAYSPDGKFLATASTTFASGTSVIRVTDVGGGTEVCAFTHNRPISSVAFSPDSKTLSAALHSGSVTRYDVAGHRALPTLAVGPANAIVTQVVYSPDGRHLITANGNGTAYILRLSEK